VTREVHPAFAVWLTGLPASGKSTVASALKDQLRETGVAFTILESDRMRKEFSDSPQYDERERELFYRSLAFIGRALVEHGISVIFDATANRRSYRKQAREHIPRFIEVFVDCPLEVCAARDPKGIYRMAREGKASNVPGLQAGYEPPENPDVIIQADREDPQVGARRIVEMLKWRGFLAETNKPVEDAP
jgi:adenylylsulfate kinase